MLFNIIIHICKGNSSQSVQIHLVEFKVQYLDPMCSGLEVKVLEIENTQYSSKVQIPQKCRLLK